jgi:hypothetical protein
MRPDTGQNETVLADCMVRTVQCIVSTRHEYRRFRVIPHRKMFLDYVCNSRIRPLISPVSGRQWPVLDVDRPIRSRRRRVQKSHNPSVWVGVARSETRGSRAGRDIRFGDGPPTGVGRGAPEAKVAVAVAGLAGRGQDHFGRAEGEPPDLAGEALERGELLV